jgi:hemerythrin superfamily protein
MTNPIEQFSAKAMGTIKAVKAGFKGLRGVFLHLAQEHGEVTALMKRVSGSADVEVRRAHWPQIRSELLSHERGEEVAVYAALREYDRTRPLAFIHEREAAQLESAVAVVDGQDLATPAWMIAFEQVLTLVQAHAEKEENEVFPQAQEVLGEERSKALREPFESAKQAAKAAIQ